MRAAPARRSGRMPSLTACIRRLSMWGSRLTLSLNASVTVSSSYRPMRPLNPVMRQSTQPTGWKGR